MNELQIFRNTEFGELGVLEQDGKPYFPATACARVLGYANTKDAIIRHCRWVVKRDLPHPQSPGKTITMNFIPEGDLYRLITHSKLPSAERFEMGCLTRYCRRSAERAVTEHQHQLWSSWRNSLPRLQRHWHR